MAYLVTDDGEVSAHVIQDETGSGVVFKRGRPEKENALTISIVWPADEWFELENFARTRLRNLPISIPDLPPIVDLESLE